MYSLLAVCQLPEIKDATVEPNSQIIHVGETFSIKCELADHGIEGTSTSMLILHCKNNGMFSETIMGPDKEIPECLVRGLLLSIFNFDLFCSNQKITQSKENSQGRTST